MSLVVTRAIDAAQIRVIEDAAKTDKGDRVVVWEYVNPPALTRRRVVVTPESIFWDAHRSVRLFRCGHYASSRDRHAECSACRTRKLPPVPRCDGRDYHVWPATNAPQPHHCRLCGLAARRRGELVTHTLQGGAWVAHVHAKPPPQTKET